MDKIKNVLSADLRKIRRNCGWKQWISALLVNQSFKTIMLYRLTHACHTKALHIIMGGGKKALCNYA